MEKTIFSPQKPALRLLRGESGMSLVVILVLICLLAAIGGIAAYRSSVDVETSGNFQKSTQVLYIAEAGIERARTALAAVTPNEALAGADGKTGQGFDADNGILSFGSTVAFGNGSYQVTVKDNDDGDGNAWSDSDGKLVVRSTGTMPDGSRRSIEVVVRKMNFTVTDFCAGVMSRGPVAINGGMQIDGRDHDTSGALLDPADGVLAVSTRGTFTIGGSGEVGGTGPDGTNYDLSKSSSTVAAVTDENATSWGNPATPEEVLGMSTDALKTIAQSGINGSQYVTDPDDLRSPMSGVTYVELPSGEVWQSVDFTGSSGILVVHNSSTNAIMKNTNQGTFKGIMIVDDYVHVHDNILGTVITLTPYPSEGNVIGNGDGNISYSRQAIQLAQNSLKAYVKVVSWQELF